MPLGSLRPWKVVSGQEQNSEGSREARVPSSSQKSLQLSGVISSLAAGGIAGAVAKTVIAPLERTKILLQVSTDQSGVVNTFTNIWKTEGVVGYWKGNGAMVVRVFPYAAIQFFAFDNYIKMVSASGRKEDATPLQRLVAGSMAGSTAVIFTYPLDLIRARLAVQTESSLVQYSGVRHAMRAIFEREGFRGLYRGINPTLLGILPYAGISFCTYETLKEHVPQWLGYSHPTLPLRLACGTAAGIVAQTLTYPLDVVRRRMQVPMMGYPARSKDGASSGAPHRPHPSHVRPHLHYRNTWHAFTAIITHESIPGLFRGLSVNYLKVVPSMAISFTVYDMMRKLLNVDSEAGAVYSG